MCGRYASVASRADLLERFVVDESNADELRGQDFNVTPTKDNPVVIARIPDDAGQAADPVRELRAFRWGLLPVFAKEIKDGARMINARAETVHQKPAYRRAFKSQRALIPVDAFYEWLETDEIGKSGKKLKQPFAIRPSDGSTTLALAGLYEVWYDKSLPRRRPEPGHPHVHDRHDHGDRQRGPDPRPDADGDQALMGGPSGSIPRNHDVDQLRGLMAPPVDGSLDMYAVSKAVNNVKNNGPELLEPLPSEG
ncbi:SOS response-associated peptidase [Kribbella sp. NBC_01510]